MVEQSAVAVLLGWKWQRVRIKIHVDHNREVFHGHRIRTTLAINKHRVRTCRHVRHEECVGAASPSHTAHVARGPDDFTRINGKWLVYSILGTVIPITKTGERAGRAIIGSHSAQATSRFPDHDGYSIR